MLRVVDVSYFIALILDKVKSAEVKESSNDYSYLKEN